MRNFSLRTKANSHRSRDVRIVYKRLIFVGLLLLILILGKNAVGSFTSFIVSPFFALKHYFDTSTATIPLYVRERSELLDQIKKLQQEISSQQGVKNTLTLLENENSELRGLLNATHEPGIVAGVVARPPQTPYDAIIIDKGADDGIITGAPVYYGSGMVLGYVRSVYAHYALVTLFSSPQVEASVYVFGPDIFTTAYGEGGGVVRLSIPQGIRIVEGDLVSLPGVEGGILGTIRKVESIPSEPEQHAYITLEVPLHALRLVHIGARAYTPPSYDDALESIQNVRDTFFTIPIPIQYDDGVSSTTATTSNTSEL